MLDVNIGLTGFRNEKPKVLFIGTPRFHNPDHNIVNLTVPDILESSRQDEMESIIDHVARFEPTRVAVVWPVGGQATIDTRYDQYVRAEGALRPIEVEQVGFRLARRLGLPRVDAVDWNDAPPGDPRAYDFQEWAAKHGSAEWKEWLSAQQDEVAAESLWMARTPVGSWLRRLNTPETRAKLRRDYFHIARQGDAFNNPGAAWVGAWYARNLRILHNLTSLFSETDGRIAAVYGAGNVALLVQLAQEASVLEVADTLAYLPCSPGDDR